MSRLRTMAETEGFEPSVPFNQDPSLAVKSVRPLRHVSECAMHVHYLKRSALLLGNRVMLRFLTCLILCPSLRAGDCGSVLSGDIFIHSHPLRWGLFSSITLPCFWGFFTFGRWGLFHRG